MISRRLSAESLLLLLALVLVLSACQGGLPFTSTPTPTPIAYQTPNWFEHAAVYEIFVRSFADSDGDGIGDLSGITGRLDYIESLGVDTIWLMPIYPSPSYHGYDVTDFFAVNPDYGTLEDLKNLVAEVHQRGMRILLDFVPSHLSRENQLFEEAYRNPESEHTEWFVFTNEANTLYAGFADSETMPRFNHFNPEVVNYLSEAALFWLDLDGDGDYTDGIDGFRVDNATFPPQEFFITLRQRIKAVNPDALLLGETWVGDTRSMSFFFQDQFDALFDFPLFSTVQGNQNSNNDSLLLGNGSPVLMKNILKEATERYPSEAMVVHFLSNHDTNRIATEMGGDLGREKLAATLLATLPGPIMLYYGEEIGMPGQKGTAPWWDAYRREPMDWYASEQGPDMTTWFHEEDRFNAPNDGISVEEEDTNPNSLLNHWRAMLALRADTPALQSDAIDFPTFSASGQGGWVITRGEGADTVVIFFNFGLEDLEITLDIAPLGASSPLDLISGAVFPSMSAGEAYTLTLAPGTAVILQNGEG